MGAAAILNPGERSPRPGSKWVPALCAIVCWAHATALTGAEASGAAIAIDRYRELNLVLMVAEGASQEWAGRLDPAAPAASAEPALEPPVPIEELQQPLSRIVDQEQVVTNAARIFRFAIDRRPEIDAEIRRIASDHPQHVTALDPGQLAEDALVIRSSLAASIEYLGRADRPDWLDGLEAYQRKTVYLRNMMEFWEFDQELAAITEQALLDTGTRIEAYQRLLEVDPRLDAFTQHLRAVEYIYRQHGKKEKPPEDPSDELIDEAAKVP